MLVYVEAETSHLGTSRQYRGLVYAYSEDDAAERLRKKIKKLEPKLKPPWPIINISNPEADTLICEITEEEP